MHVIFIYQFDQKCILSYWYFIFVYVTMDYFAVNNDREQTVCCSASEKPIWWCSWELEVCQGWSGQGIWYRVRLVKFVGLQIFLYPSGLLCYQIISDVSSWFMIVL